MACKRYTSHFKEDQGHQPRSFQSVFFCEDQLWFSCLGKFGLFHLLTLWEHSHYGTTCDRNLRKLINKFQPGGFEPCLKQKIKNFNNKNINFIAKDDYSSWKHLSHFHQTYVISITIHVSTSHIFFYKISEQDRLTHAINRSVMCNCIMDIWNEKVNHITLSLTHISRPSLSLYYSEIKIYNNTYKPFISVTIIQHVISTKLWPTEVYQFKSS